MSIKNTQEIKILNYNVTNFEIKDLLELISNKEFLNQINKAIENYKEAVKARKRITYENNIIRQIVDFSKFYIQKHLDHIAIILNSRQVAGIGSSFNNIANASQNSNLTAPKNSNLTTPKNNESLHIDENFNFNDKAKNISSIDNDASHNLPKAPQKNKLNNNSNLKDNNEQSKKSSKPENSSNPKITNQESSQNKTIDKNNSADILLDNNEKLIESKLENALFINTDIDTGSKMINSGGFSCVNFSDSFASSLISNANFNYNELLEEYLRIFNNISLLLIFLDSVYTNCQYFEIRTIKDIITDFHKICINILSYTKSHNQMLYNKCKELQSHNIMLFNDKNELINNKNESINNKNTLNKTINNLRAKLEESIEKSKKCKETNQNLAEKNQNLEKQIAKQENKISNLVREHKKLIEKERMQINQLVLDIAEIENQKAVLEKKIETHQNDKYDFLIKYRDLERQYKTIETNLNRSLAENNRLSNENAKIEKKYKNIETDLNTAVAENTRLSNENAKIKKNIKRIGIFGFICILVFFTIKFVY